MPVAHKIAEFIERSSWIRAMFEAGAKLKAQKGAENVFDFSLGNPNIEPPEKFFEVVSRLVADRTPGRHAYMPNAGYPHVRAKVADYLSREHGPAFSENEIIMTVGAAGALNIVLKAIVDPGAEVVVPTPYFVEYDFYLDNHGGLVKRVPTTATFELDIAAMADAISEKTCAVLINNPNNPSGAVYTQESVDALAAMLTEKSKQLGKAIYLISDEPYRQIVFDGLSVPSIFAAYPNSIVVTSFSKNLSLPGQRIGYAAVHPDIADKGLLLGGMTLANRILGFVNAPGIMQLAVAELLEDAAEVAEYARKRELILGVLDEAGYEYVRPGGAFYVFPKSPIPDDVAFCKLAIEQNLLLVPGSGFMGPGYFRIAYCCDDATIINSVGAFKRTLAAAK
ncbi:MAG: pyridoxal phosphate-dependent aminotransferase [Desulfarculus sp.]|nr:pyridoxal phosphate-dependent aminotransferase [Pseudomonadota bacterium]MBV1716993.1 pyridoxal phosphate-dependent aminotransferase [Desulfarculus sp.]MBU4575864.1 pyridoxal phosphate-dependent aminotransferase [Pseudomonadota bacterium]MBU4597616.1 pyridoxal phosphate-dependent aminotransferase [Pseudomonadota bacterium]MBV1736569.1 pyridoxal phosphate-dependent aminotransferase [Desulfarculus sp.]